jgi:flagellin
MMISRNSGAPGSGFASLLAQRYQRLNSMRLAQSLTRLASGRRINRGADDPAGLIASEQLRGTIAALDAESGALDRVDQQASTADGALGEVSSLLNEANSLVVANANDAGLSDAERQANQMQIDSILASVDRIGRTSSFAGTKLLDGSFTLTATNKSVSVDHISSNALGETTESGQTYTLADLKSGGRLAGASGDGELAQRVLGAARSQVSTLRGRIGAFQKHTIGSRRSSLAVASENLRAAESQIADLDYAAEVSQTVRYELLQRASLGSLKILNRTSRSRLNLLG